MFDCATCGKKPGLKKKLGCHGGVEWRFPQHTGKHKIDRCPMRVITADVVALFTAVSLAGGTMSLSEQRAVPVRYAEAFLLAKIERDAAVAWKARRRKNND